MNDKKQAQPQFPRREWVLALAICVTCLLYLISRLVRTWGVWPEDSGSAVLRIVEIVVVASFAVMALWNVLRPKASSASETKGGSAGGSVDELP